MSELSEQEKVKIRHHCGYLNVQASSTFVLGVPASVETQFLIEGAMMRIIPEAVPEVRRHLQILDQIENQAIQNLELLQITKLDTIEVNSTGPDREQRQLTQAYDKWVNSLCNALGASRNPFDKRTSGQPGGGLNLRVSN